MCFIRIMNQVIMLNNLNDAYERNFFVLSTISMAFVDQVWNEKYFFAYRFVYVCFCRESRRTTGEGEFGLA